MVHETLFENERFIFRLKRSATFCESGRLRTLRGGISDGTWWSMTPSLTPF
jgi:hypothetical protein